MTSNHAEVSVQHRVLVVGCGSIGERHIRCFLHTARAMVSACDVSQARLQELRGRYSLASVHQTFDAVDFLAFDVVVLCTPAHLHIPMGQRVVDAGVALLCEKPLSTSLDGVDALIAAIEHEGVAAGVAYTYRSMPGVQRLKAELDAGRIGTPLHITFHGGQDFRVARPDFARIYYASKATGGGTIADGATHIVNLIQWLIGPYRSVYAEYDHLLIEHVEVEDTAALVLRFRDTPAIASVAMNQYQAPNEGILEIAGSAGNLRYETHTTRVGIFPRGARAWQYTDSLQPERDMAYIAQAHHFLDAVEGNRQFACSFAEAKHTLQVCLAAYASLEQGRRMEVEG
ncbi:MAG: Gfo/Idh/MocA family oxidoreductase [Deinococcus sp.]|nr:Gfo/Idh/MocA family oxidoreductase [Deinococcus sp.]